MTNHHELKVSLSSTFQKINGNIVTSIEGVESISKPFCFKVDILLALEDLIAEDFNLKEVFNLEISWGKTRKIQGIVDHCIDLPHNYCGTMFPYRLEICSKLYRLKTETKTIAYTHECIKDILYKILSKAFKKKSNIQIKLKQKILREVIILQYEENDFDFFERIMKLYNFYYFSVFSDEGEESIYITDQKFLENTSHYSFCPEKEEFNNTQDSQCLEYVSYLNQEVDFLTDKTTYLGRGQFIDNGIANIISLSNHPIQFFNKNYHLISLRTVAQNIQESIYYQSVTSIDSFYTEFTLIDMHTVYKENKLSRLHHPNYLLPATIVADEDNLADINPNGDYLIWLHCSEKPIDQPEAAFRSPILKEYQVGKSGFGGPLHKNTMVLIEWIYTEKLWPSPVIMGVLPSIQNAKAIAENKTTNFAIHHHDGSEFSLKDNQIIMSSGHNEYENLQYAKMYLNQDGIHINSPIILHNTQDMTKAANVKKEIVTYQYTSYIYKEFVNTGFTFVQRNLHNNWISAGGSVAINEIMCKNSADVYIKDAISTKPIYQKKDKMDTHLNYLKCLDIPEMAVVDLGAIASGNYMLTGGFLEGVFEQNIYNINWHRGYNHNIIIPYNIEITGVVATIVESLSVLTGSLNALTAITNLLGGTVMTRRRLKYIRQSELKLYAERMTQINRKLNVCADGITIKDRSNPEESHDSEIIYFDCEPNCST